jgi:hypothetical protein
MADCEVFSIMMRNTWPNAGTPSALTQVVPDALHVNPVGHVPQEPASTPPLEEPLDEPELLPELEPLDEPELLPELEPLEEPELPPELDPLLLEPLDDEPPPSPPEPAGLLPEPPHAPMMRAARAHDRRAW